MQVLTLNLRNIVSFPLIAIDAELNIQLPSPLTESGTREAVTHIFSMDCEYLAGEINNRILVNRL
jgi:hypothetical protein